MTLSLLTLDISSPSVRQCLVNAQDMHRTIMKAFDSSRQEGNVLYRLVRTNNKIQIYVQSKDCPAWERIAPNGFHCEKTKDISLLPESFKQGQILQFSLLCYPAKKVTGDGKNSRRVLLRGEEEQLKWLGRQGEKYGFNVIEAHVMENTEMKSGIKNSGAFTIAGVPFEGVLKICDPVAFRNAFEKGIGSEKAYGLGMLMISRI